VKDSQTPTYSLRELVLYALKLGTIGFGGPVALVGYMYRDLVEQREWISEEDYKDGLALAQLAPGPLAAQLSIYLGYVHYRILGASLVGLAFILPSFFMVVVLGWLYKLYGGLSWMQAIFYGVGASIIGIIAMSAYKLTIKTIGKNWILWGIYLVSTIYTAITETEQVVLILLGGIIVWLKENSPKSLKSKSAKLLGLFAMPAIINFGMISSDQGILWKVFIFFAKAGAFIFGSGLAIVPFLYGGVVKEYHWLNDRQFLDAVAVAMITPGPVVITVGFIGFLVNGFSGACMAALGTFLPCYLFTVIPAPYFKKYGKIPAIASFVNGVTAAAIGTITGAVFVLGRKSITDIPTVLLAIATVGILTRTKRIPEPLIIFISALIGLLLKFKVGL